MHKQLKELCPSSAILLCTSLVSAKNSRDRGWRAHLKRKRASASASKKEKGIDRGHVRSLPARTWFKACEVPDD